MAIYADTTPGAVAPSVGHLQARVRLDPTQSAAACSGGCRRLQTGGKAAAQCTLQKSAAAVLKAR